MNQTNRLEKTFSDLKKKDQAALVTFITSGDPDFKTCDNLLCNLPKSGSDIIELGMPFSDPMADGPAIQAANLRSLKNGGSLNSTLELVSSFRKDNEITPIVLMGYFNPIYQYGIEAFLDDANNAGVDGLILVDMPTEEDDELCDPALTRGLSWIRLVTPTTDLTRLPIILQNSSGFIYHVSIAGITGTRSAEIDSVKKALDNIRSFSNLPIAVGFGIRTVENVRAISEIADGVVVGSAIINEIEKNLDNNGAPKKELVKNVCSLVERLAAGTHR